MWYGGNNVISYASVWDDYWGIRIIGSTDGDVVKIMYMILDVMLLCMKGELIWEEIYKSFSREKLFIKERKREEKFIIYIVHLN